MCLSSLVWRHLLHFLLSSPYLWHSDHILWVKEKANWDGDFVCIICMQRETCNYLPNMRAIQCNLAMIGRNVSNLSPHASYMMDGIFLWQKETHREASMRVRNARLCVGSWCASSTCSCMHSCISMSALWIHCEGSYCVCVPALAIWHADLEGQCRNYWYRS